MSFVHYILARGNDEKKNIFITKLYLYNFFRCQKSSSSGLLLYVQQPESVLLPQIMREGTLIR